MNAKWQQYTHCLHISTTSVPTTMWSSSFLVQISPATSESKSIPGSCFWDAPSAPLRRLISILRIKKRFLLHGQSDPVRCHRSRLDRDPQVFGIGRIFFLLCFWPWRWQGVVTAAATTAAVGMTTAAAVAAHQHCCEEDEQGKHQQDHQADCVIGPLVVFFCSEVPQLVEKNPGCCPFSNPWL